jgi:predicted NBD/HSP70 family sugar kinase
LGRSEGEILKLLRGEGNLSRAELARRCKLTPPALTRIVGGLIQSGLLREGAQVKSSLGRPSTGLLLVPDAAYVAGVHLSSDRVEFVVCDLSGHVLSYKEVQASSGHEPVETSVRAAAEIVRLMLAELGLGEADLLGLGVSVPGWIDRDKRSGVVWRQNGWREAAFADLFEQELNCPVVLNHNVAAMALAENLYGSGGGATERESSFLFLYMRAGLGAGVIVDGRPLHNQGGAVEIGHIPVETGGRKCECGAFGCLEAYCSESAVISDLGLSDMPEDNLILALSRDEEAFDRFIERLSIGVATAVHLFNPEMICFGGHFHNAPDQFLDRMQAALDSRILPPLRSKISLRRSELGQVIGGLGAAASALEELFYSGKLVART